MTMLHEPADVSAPSMPKCQNCGQEDGDHIHLSINRDNYTLCCTGEAEDALNEFLTKVEKLETWRG